VLNAIATTACGPALWTRSTMVTDKDIIGCYNKKSATVTAGGGERIFCKLITEAG
jgi:hypothetical protein